MTDQDRLVIAVSIRRTKLAVTGYGPVSSVHRRIKDRIGNDITPFVDRTQHGYHRQRLDKMANHGAVRNQAAGDVNALMHRRQCRSAAME